jgi:formylglycine-generating enzyme required for sulfatase activity
MPLALMGCRQVLGIGDPRLATADGEAPADHVPRDEGEAGATDAGDSTRVDVPAPAPPVEPPSDGPRSLAIDASVDAAVPAPSIEVITFEDLPNPPPRDDDRKLKEANGGSGSFKNVTWDDGFYVVGDQYVERFNNEGGTHPFATPHSRSYALFNVYGADGLTLTTTRVLVGVWLSRPDLGRGPKGTNQVTLRALQGSTALASVSIDLVDATPVHLDTIAFAGLSGITGYRFDRVATGADGYGGGHYVADDFEFLPAPSSPPSLPSCAGLPASCGPAHDESCCATLPVPGGTFDRYNNPSYPAMLGDFLLDKYEITVGRMRKFVEAYPASRPRPGAGAHPRIPGSGWRAEWDSSLPDRAGLLRDLTCADHSWSSSSENDRLPIGCLTYYEAFAFCAWDGGRLPTWTEWNYAAAGGAEQRPYPWVVPGAPAVIDLTHANYGVPCGGCSARDFLEVGGLPLGNGRWGHADLSGNIWEWNLDAAGGPGSSCNDCARLAASGDYVISGGSVIDNAKSVSVAEGYNSAAGSIPSWLHGARCAR